MYSTFSSHASGGTQGTSRVDYAGKRGKPGIDQITDMFKNMGYDVRPDNPEELIFKPVDVRANYTYIRVIELDTGEEVYQEDRDLRAILETLLNKR